MDVSSSTSYFWFQTFHIETVDYLICAFIELHYNLSTYINRINAHISRIWWHASSEFLRFAAGRNGTRFSVITEDSTSYSRPIWSVYYHSMFNNILCSISTIQFETANRSSFLVCRVYSSILCSPRIRPNNTGIPVVTTDQICIVAGRSCMDVSSSTSYFWFEAFQGVVVCDFIVFGVDWNRNLSLDTIDCARIWLNASFHRASPNFS